jgi:CBS domain-containing protein
MYGYLSAVLAEKGRHVYTISPDATVQVAVHTMNEYGVGALLVMERSQPVGMFTERDVLRRVVELARDPATAHVADVMTTTLATADPATRVEDAMAMMTNRRFRHLPIVQAGRVVGLVSIGDLMRWVSMNQEAHIQHLTDYITGKAPE